MLCNRNYGEGNGTPLQYSCLENPMDRGAWWLQSMGLLRVGHDWATSLSLFTFMHWRRKWQPTPVFLPGESPGWGSLVGCRLWGCTVGHDFRDLAAVAVATGTNIALAWPAAIHGVAKSRTQLSDWSDLIWSDTLKTKQIHRKRDQICGYHRQGMGKGELNKGGPKEQLPSYKIGEYWGSGIQHDW